MLPLLLIILPVSIRWIRALLDYDESPTINHIRIVIISMYSLMNALFTIIFVGPYRSHAYDTFIYPWLSRLFTVLGIAHLTPKRKSTAWITSVQPSGANLNKIRSSLPVSNI
jgi:hypothetical protein